jgi:hypothetical protein
MKLSVYETLTQEERRAIRGYMGQVGQVQEFISCTILLFARLVVSPF